MNSSRQLRMLVFASLLAALMTAGAFISIPVGPVPIVLQNMFVFLAGLLLGSRWGLASVGVYLLAGACGLPVFAGGMGGIGRIVGPTGGYLIGYLPAVFIIGYLSQKGAARISIDIKNRRQTVYCNISITAHHFGASGGGVFCLDGVATFLHQAGPFH